MSNKPKTFKKEAMFFYIEPLYYNSVTRKYERVHGHTYLSRYEIRSINFFDDQDHASIATSDPGYPYNISKERALEIAEILNEQ